MGYGKQLKVQHSADGRVVKAQLDFICEDVHSARYTAPVWAGVIAFLASGEFGIVGHLPLADCIAAVRHATCNPALSVIVGGPMFALHPEFVDRVGADGMTIDGSEAPALAERLVLQNALRHVGSGR